MSYPKPRRRWYQFGLSTLLNGLTFFSLPLGYIAWEREQCRRGEEARQMVHRHYYPKFWMSAEGLEDFVERAGENYQPSRRRPDWLKAILGNDRFRQIEIAVLFGDPLTEHELRQLAVFPNLRQLRISGPNMTPHGVSHLRGLNQLESFVFSNSETTSVENWELLSAWKQLRELSFEESDFRDEDIIEISSLRRLKQLCLRQTRITDAGLDSLGELTSLEVLDLSGTEVSDDGLRHLRRLTNLHQLKLVDTKVTGAGLVHLAALPEFKELEIGGPTLTDDALASITQLSNLKTLSLHRMKVNDSGASHLSRLKNLETLWLYQTRVPDGTILEESVPHVSILGDSK